MRAPEKRKAATGRQSAFQKHQNVQINNTAPFGNYQPAQPLRRCSEALKFVEVAHV